MRDDPYGITVEQADRAILSGNINILVESKIKGLIRPWLERVATLTSRPYESAKRIEAYCDQLISDRILPSLVKEASDEIVNKNVTFPSYAELKSIILKNMKLAPKREDNELKDSLLRESKKLQQLELLFVEKTRAKYPLIEKSDEEIINALTLRWIKKNHPELIDDSYDIPLKTWRKCALFDWSNLGTAVQQQLL